MTEHRCDYCKRQAETHKILCNDVRLVLCLGCVSELRSRQMPIRHISKVLA